MAAAFTAAAACGDGATPPVDTTPPSLTLQGPSGQVSGAQSISSAAADAESPVSSHTIKLNGMTVASGAEGSISVVFNADTLANGWMSELKGFVDMVYGGQEGTLSSLSRNATPGGGAVRGPLDVFTYNHPLRIATRAGKDGYGLIKTP